MKTIKKNVMILTLALFGLGIIGNNVSYGTATIKEGKQTLIGTDPCTGFYCCCPGTRTCGADNCPEEVCEDVMYPIGQ